jgi:hypothetical protein
MSNYTESVQSPDTITIGQFITKHGIRFECRRVDARPDGLMDEGNGTHKVHFGEMRHFRCRIIAGHGPEFGPYTRGPKLRPRLVANGWHGRPRSFGLYFSQGSAHTTDPTLADVLDCLASDASGYENARVDTRPDEKQDKALTVFEGWASEYGYDTDSRKAEKTFRAIKRQSEQLKRTIGAEAYEELLWQVERL